MVTQAKKDNLPNIGKVQLVEKWPVWLHNQTGRKVNEG